MLSNILVLLAIGAVFYFMMRKAGGCCGSHGGHEHHGHAAADAETHSHHHAGGAAGEKDPVCGMKVEPGGLELDHDGRVYRFCSDRCRELFAQEPGKYV